MVTVDIRGVELSVKISGWDAVWALKRSLRMPLANVAGARVEAVAGKPGWKLIGTGIPRGLAAGLFRKQGQTSFWVAHQQAPALVIDLRNERYARLVLQVDNPQEVADRINAAI